MWHTSKRLVNLLLAAALLISLFSMPNMILAASAETATTRGTSYYVDANNGNDDNNGTSESSAWRSITKVNSVTFQPGDQILFKAGCSWEGEILMPKGNGTANAPITISKYGDESEENPHFDAKGKTVTVELGQAVNNGMTWTLSASVWLDGQDYWTISDLDVSNTAGSGQADRGVRQGIWVRGKRNGITRGIKVTNNTIHNVDGENRRALPDGSNMYWTAAINLTQPLPGSESNRFDEILIENNRIENTLCGGIKICYEAEYSAQLFKDVVVRENYIKNVGSDGIIVSHSVNPLIEKNVVLNSGALGNTQETVVIAGLWITNCNGALIQHNEVAGTKYFTGDGQAFDTDWGNSGNIIYQYNYTHENEGGFFLNSSGVPGVNGPAKSILRYNISINDGYTHDHVDIITGDVKERPVEVYNNIFYNSHWWTQMNPGSCADYSFMNNIFYSVNGMRAANDSRFEANCYAPANAFSGGAYIPNDSRAIVADPLFVNPQVDETKTVLTDILAGFKLQSGSPLIDAGMPVPQNEGIHSDFYGNTLNYIEDGLPDIGIYEFKGPKTNRLGTRIEAEAYNEKSNKLQVEKRDYLDNGSNICNTEVGEWLHYSNVNFCDGATKFEARVSCGDAGQYKDVRGRMEIHIDTQNGPIVGILEVNSAGAYGPENNGWNFYRTESCTLISEISGVHDVYLKWVDTDPARWPSGFNLDWFRFSSGNAAASFASGNHVEAENATSRSETLTNEDCSDSPGGYHIRGAKSGAWLAFEHFKFGEYGSKQFVARVQTGTATYGTDLLGGILSIHLDNLENDPIGTVEISATDGWKTVYADIPQTTGEHTVYLKWSGAEDVILFNLDWFKFNPYFAVGQKIEAELFSSNASNIRLEICQDAGGGLNVSGTWEYSRLTFNDVDFGTGAEWFTARVNSGTTAMLTISVNGTPIGVLNIPKTNGWETLSCELSKTTGIHDVTLDWGMSGFSLNWFQFDEHLNSKFSLNERIEAEAYDAASAGINPEQRAWSDNGTHITGTAPGKWVCYKNVDLGDGAARFEARVAAAYYGNPHNRDIHGKAEIRLDNEDGTVIGTIFVNSAGLYGPDGNGWNLFRTESCKLATDAAGVHDIYIKWVEAVPGDTDGAFIADWFRFLSVEPAADIFKTGNRVEVEYSDSRSLNLTNEDCNDTDGGSHIRGAKSGDWLKFENFDFDTGSHAAEVRVLTGTPPIAGNAALSGGTLEFYLDEETTPIGTAVVSDNAGWQTVSCNLNQMVSGNHTLVLKWNGTENINLFDLNWIRFKTLAETGDIDAAAVDAKIEAIGEVTLDKEVMIQEARAAYNALGDAAKAKVTQLSILEQAEVKLAELKAAAEVDAKAAAEAASVDAKIDAIGDVTLDKKHAIQETRAAYNALSAAAKSKVQKLHILEQAEAKIRELEIAQDISYILPIIASIGSDNERNMPFDDISQRDSYYNAVCYLYKNNVMNGVSKTQFAPNATLTRAMVVTILYRIDGAYPVYDAESFQDVPAGKWYTEAIEWAASNEIVQGIGNGKFSPNGEITREQLAAILHRYAAFKGYDTTSSATLNADANISNWATASVSWAVAWELLNGGKSVQATEHANRSEVAIAIYTFIKRIIR